MNKIYLHSTPEGIKLIEGDKMPVKTTTNQRCHGKPYCCYGKRCEALDYDDALQAAKASGVPIGNEVIAIELINRKVREFGSNAKVWDSLYGKEGTIYGPFTVGYRIERVLAENQKLMPGEGATYEMVAILYDDTPEKEESQEDQEEIFDEVFCQYFDIIYRDRKSMHDAVRELMEKFTITRKQ